MPDQELLDLAADGTLNDRRVRSEQVQRMLRHPDSSRFVEQFAEQWLKLKNMDSVSVQRELYPDFDERLRADMRGETIAYLRHLIDENHGVDKLLQSDFTMFNGRLARHYGIKGVTGETFRRVDLSEKHHRGGLLGQAGFLLANSTGADSHAIRRAVWNRDRLLNDPPAPPPPDVPSLEESTPNFHELSVRQQLEVHRQKPACASCHRNLDAWGVALENYDATGRWRDEVRRIREGKLISLPVESTGELPGGIVLPRAVALREHLVAAHQHHAAWSLVTRLRAHALAVRWNVDTPRRSRRSRATCSKETGNPGFD
jgi:hypothetical protein